MLFKYIKKIVGGKQSMNTQHDICQRTPKERENKRVTQVRCEWVSRSNDTFPLAPRRRDWAGDPSVWCGESSLLLHLPCHLIGCDPEPATRDTESQPHMAQTGSHPAPGVASPRQHRLDFPLRRVSVANVTTLVLEAGASALLRVPIAV